MILPILRGWLKFRFFEICTNLRTKIMNQVALRKKKKLLKVKIK